MPRCLGIYQSGDSQCDGEPTGATQQDRMPCVYRDRCLGFQKLLEQTGRQPDFWLRFEKADGQVYSFAKNPERLDHHISKQISKWGIRNGRAARRTVQPELAKPKKPPKISPEHMAKLRANKPPSRSALQLAGKARSKQFATAREAVTELAQWYTKQISEKTGRTIRDSQAAARPGDLFLIDRSESANYVGVYARKSDGRKLALTSFYYRPVSGRLEVRVAADFEAYTSVLSKSALAKLGPEDFTGKDGAFKVRIRSVDTEKASIIAETLAAATRRGIFDLPEPE